MCRLRATEHEKHVWMTRFFFSWRTALPCCRATEKCSLRPHTCCWKNTGSTDFDAFADRSFPLGVYSRLLYGHQVVPPRGLSRCQQGGALAVSPLSVHKNRSRCHLVPRCTITSPSVPTSDTHTDDRTKYLRRAFSAAPSASLSAEICPSFSVICLWFSSMLRRASESNLLNFARVSWGATPTDAKRNKIREIEARGHQFLDGVHDCQPPETLLTACSRSEEQTGREGHAGKKRVPCEIFWSQTWTFSCSAVPSPPTTGPFDIPVKLALPFMLGSTADMSPRAKQVHEVDTRPPNFAECRTR